MLLRHAATTDARRRCLDAAEPTAVTPADWCALAAYAARSGDDRDRVDRYLARATAGDLVVGRSIARLQRDALGDRDAAYRTLAAHAELLLHASTPASAWCLLADAWHEHGDRDAALDYLTHAHAALVEPRFHELLALATTCHRLGDPAARELVARAEAVAADVPERCTIANTLAFVLHDLAAARVAAAGALAAARTADDAVHVTTLLERLYDGDDVIEAALAPLHARLDVDTWMELARQSWLSTRPFQTAEDYLERAVAIASDDLALARIEELRVRMYQYDSEPAIERAPASLLPRRDTCGFACEPARLLDWLRARITDDQLRQIADNDYAIDDASFATLVAIRDTGLVPRPLPGNTRENVELERWSSMAPVDHVSRAFACTLLCLVGPGTGGGEHESMAALVESCFALGPEAVDGLLGLFAAIEDDLFILLGIVLAAAWRDPGDVWIAPAIARLEALEQRLGPPRHGSAWLFAHSNYDQRYPLWRALADEVLGAPHLRGFAERLR